MCVFFFFFYRYSCDSKSRLQAPSGGFPSKWWCNNGFLKNALFISVVPYGSGGKSPRKYCVKKKFHKTWSLYILLKKSDLQFFKSFFDKFVCEISDYIVLVNIMIQLLVCWTKPLKHHIHSRIIPRCIILCLVYFLLFYQHTFNKINKFVWDVSISIWIYEYIHNLCSLTVLCV